MQKRNLPVEVQNFNTKKHPTGIIKPNKQVLQDDGKTKAPPNKIRKYLFYADTSIVDSAVLLPLNTSTGTKILLSRFNFSNTGEKSLKLLGPIHLNTLRISS